MVLFLLVSSALLVNWHFASIGDVRGDVGVVLVDREAADLPAVRRTTPPPPPHPPARIADPFEKLRPKKLVAGANPRLELKVTVNKALPKPDKTRAANATYCTQLRMLGKASPLADRVDEARSVLRQLFPPKGLHVLAYADTRVALEELFKRANDDPQGRRTPPVLEPLAVAYQPHTCAVVGNSGALMQGPPLGRHIDANDVVMRMNAAPNSGKFASRVGARSTIRLLNKHWSRSYSDMVPRKAFLRHVVAHAGGNATRSAALDALLAAKGKDGGYGSTGRGGRFCKPTCPIVANETVLVARGDGNIKGGMRMLDNVLWRSIGARAGMLPAAFVSNARIAYRLLLALSGEGSSGACVESGPRRVKSLSTGMLATLLARVLCDGPVRLYGFGSLMGGRSSSAEYQYHGSRARANIVDHDFAEELKVFRFLKKTGDVSFCGGANVRGGDVCTKSSGGNGGVLREEAASRRSEEAAVDGGGSQEEDEEKTEEAEETATRAGSDEGSSHSSR